LAEGGHMEDFELIARAFTAGLNFLVTGFYLNPSETPFIISMIDYFF
jgi:hypothetical protein